MTVRKTVCFLISDFLAEGYEPALRVARRRHDLIPIVINDPREMEWPDVGFVTVEDAETGDWTLVDTSNRALRRQYAADRQRAAAARETMFRRMDTEVIEIQTDRPYVEPLVQYFRRRERRR